MFPVSPGARRATTTSWVGARGAGACGRGREAEPKLSTLHPSLPQLLSMPSCPASPWEDFPGAHAAVPGFRGSRREAGGSSCGGWRGRGRRGVVGEGRGECHRASVLRAGESRLSPIRSRFPSALFNRAAPALPLTPHSGFAEMRCGTKAGPSFAELGEHGERGRDWEADPSASLIATTWTHASQTSRCLRIKMQILIQLASPVSFNWPGLRVRKPNWLPSDVDAYGPLSIKDLENSSLTFEWPSFSKPAQNRSLASTEGPSCIQTDGMAANK